MSITLIELPYSQDALAPTISAETLSFHHGKHHKAYVDKTNELTKGTDLEEAALEEIIKSAKASDNKQLYNQAAQVWNHGFYWMSLSPEAGQPSKDLAARIEHDFGSLDDLNAKLLNAAVKHFGSGWAWLIAGNNGALSIETTHDAGCPITGSGNPLLTVDVWEHAYYLDRQNDRKAYVDAVIKERLNWAFADENFARGAAWEYPA